jgi:hypothetical protein
MKGAVCRSMMCGLPREDAWECERLMSVQLMAGAISPSLRPVAADGGGRPQAWRATATARLGAYDDRLVSEFVRGDLG